MCGRNDHPPYGDPSPYIEHKAEWTFDITQATIDKRAPVQRQWERDIFGPDNTLVRLRPTIEVLRRWADRWARRNGYAIKGGSEFYSLDGPMDPLERRWTLRFRVVGLEPVPVPVPA